jgi:hypothetical protein
LAAVAYVFSYALCDGPSCGNPSLLSNMLAPVVGVTYYPFYIQNEVSDSLVYNHIYVDANTYTVERKYPAVVEWTIRTILFVLALSIYLIVCYIISCGIYTLYEKVKHG